MTDTTLAKNNTDQFQLEDICSKIIAGSSGKVTALSALPIPLIEVGSMLFIQMDMIKKLAKEFNVDVEHSSTPLISSLTAAILSKVLSELTQNLSEQLKLDSLLSDTLIKSTIAGFLTNVMGEIYFHHFKQGGTMEDMDLRTYSNYIVQQAKSDRMSLETLSDKAVNKLASKASSLI